MIVKTNEQSQKQMKGRNLTWKYVIVVDVVVALSGKIESAYHHNLVKQNVLVCVLFKFSKPSRHLFASRQGWMADNAYNISVNHFDVVYFAFQIYAQILCNELKGRCLENWQIKFH